MAHSPKEGNIIANRKALQQALRYQPDIIARMEDLLDAVASHMPRVIARRIVEAPATGPVALPVEGTVMFADIDGFTQLSESFARTASEAGTEELTDLINRFLEILIATTMPYGGDIQKFGGDAGMLLFEGENHALRAIAASLEVQKEMAAQMGEVKTSLGNFPLRISIGLGSGRMVGMGLGSRDGREWLLTGSPLKAMGRAQEIAPPGDVVIEVTSEHECDPRVQYKEVENQRYLITGLQSPIEPHPLAPLPAPPQLDPPEYLEWLFSRLDALTPYLAPSLLELLTTTDNPKQVGQSSEHRQVTIMMVSLANFPDLSIHWDNPEALQRAVHEPNDIFVNARDVIQQYDGIVNKIGASPQGAYLMALFGAPLAHEDDPLRAVLAALELQERSDLPLRIGINSGFVFAGDVGAMARREYTVMGDEVNLTYRLMSTSAPGQIWLGPNTARHPIIQHRVNSVAGKPQKFKGKSGLITPFIAQSVHRMGNGAEVEEQALIGREAEVQRIEALLQTAINDQSQAAVLSGPAGVGKTRLVYEIMAHARAMGVRVYEGIAPSYGEHLPYAAWERPLLASLGLENTLQNQRSHEFEAALDRYDLNPWGGLLAPLIGLDVLAFPEIMALTPEQREKYRQDILATLWERIAAEAPTLLVLENAHWMPATSITLLDALIEHLPQRGLLLLVTQRDEEAALQRHRLHENPNTQTISLEPFPRAMTLALARQVAQAARLPAEVERWLVKRGGGIPLFTVEAVRTLLTSGILAQSAGEWRLTQPLEEAPLPETAYGMIQSRIDQLEPPSRHLLRAATVVGEPMTVPMLVAGYGEESRPAVQRRLPRLVPLGLVPGDAQGETLIFRQPLIREVAYHGLPFRVRRLVHQRLAMYLNQYRERATSNWMALLAHHAFEGQEWELAIRSNLELGKRAQQNYLLDQATQAYRRVTEAADAGGLTATEARMEALHRLGQTLTLFGRYDEALQSLQQARQLLPAVPSTPQDIENLGRLEYDIAAVLTNQGTYTEALEHIERGLQLPNITQSLVGAQLQMQKAGILHRRGNYDEEESWVRNSVEIAGRLSGEEALKVKARALYLLAYLASVRGDPDQALKSGAQSLEVCQKLQDIVGEINARTNLLLINLTLSNWQTAVEHGERGLKLAQRIHHTEGEARLAANLGEVYRYQGRIQEARIAFNLALKLTQEAGITYGIALMENNLAALALYENKYDEAQERLDRAEMLFQQIESETMIPETSRHRSALALARSDTQTALTLAQRSLDVATAQGASSEAGQTQQILGEIYLARGDCEQAAQAIEQAIAIAQANQDRYRQAQATLTKARWRKTCGEADLAEQTLQNAVQEFTTLGASYDQEQAQSLLEAWKK
ncbi:MAG: tetratricopeptide repeat protein [Anaerolineae bacterium]|nr:tetratricopeptide repeat protein [Anaerolineae bacterium]